MDISVNNVDMAYEQCRELHSLMDIKGALLISDLGSNIRSLKQNWQAEDAGYNINMLIDMYTALSNSVINSVNVISFAADRIISIQEVRRANHAGMGNAGEHLRTRDSFLSIEKVPVDFKGYKVGVAPQLSTDYSKLVSIRESYENLIKSFESKKEELFANWTAGANITRARQIFSDFLSDAERFKMVFSDVLQNLDIAVNKNVQSISE